MSSTQTQQGSLPVVYTIAGSDSSGGAGVEADLATLRDFGVHGCPLITALTAQNSGGVQRVLPTPLPQLRAAWSVLESSAPADAVKIGMLATAEIAGEAAALLARYSGPVVCDPVMSASAGGELLGPGGVDALRALLPRVSLLTPNLAEAQNLTGLPVRSASEMHSAARALLKLGAGAVLLTGGHFEAGDPWCHDYFCSPGLSFWLRGERIATPHNHGTGCTLASAIAACLARSLPPEDAVVVAKMAVSRGLRRARALGPGPGAVAHGDWQAELADLPTLWDDFPGSRETGQFPEADAAGLGLYPVVDSVQWVEKLFAEGLCTVQLRIKRGSDEHIDDSIRRAVAAQDKYRARLFVNDHWQRAIEHGAYGVHLGQEDLAGADLAAIAKAGLRLGTSNHAWHELARSHAIVPSYIALGPIYPTTTKVMRFAPQGLTRLREWVDLLAPRYPLTAIGGIDESRAPAVAATGVGSIAVVRAITEAADYRSAVRNLHASLAESGAGDRCGPDRVIRRKTAQ